MPPLKSDMMVLLFLSLAQQCPSFRGKEAIFDVIASIKSV